MTITQMLHGAGILAPTNLPLKNMAQYFVGKYSMEHLGWTSDIDHYSYLHVTFGIEAT